MGRGSISAPLEEWPFGNAEAHRKLVQARTSGALDAVKGQISADQLSQTVAGSPDEERVISRLGKGGNIDPVFKQASTGRFSSNNLTATVKFLKNSDTSRFLLQTEGQIADRNLGSIDGTVSSA